MSHPWPFSCFFLFFSGQFFLVSFIHLPFFSFLSCTVLTHCLSLQGGVDLDLDLGTEDIKETTGMGVGPMGLRAGAEVEVLRIWFHREVQLALLLLEDHRLREVWLVLVCRRVTKTVIIICSNSNSSSINTMAPSRARRCRRQAMGTRRMVMVTVTVLDRLALEVRFYFHFF